MITVNNFRFDINGLSIAYAVNNYSKTVSFDPSATCNLFQDLGIIEGFDIDKNLEPVILYTDSDYQRPVTGFCFWCDYVRTFGFIQRHAEIIADHIESTKSFTKLKATISKLLTPAGAK